LSTTTFTIDQLNGRIFNQDSLPYGTEVDKVIATVGYVSSISLGSIQVMQEAVGDTILWNGTDSLDYSKPVKFVITAYDGVTQKIYDTRLNVHQVVPDSMVWTKFPSSLPGNSVAERKVISFATDNVEQYYMYTTEADGYHLYTATVVEQNNWSTKTLTGLPAGKVNFDQLAIYENRLYVPSSEQKLYSSIDGQTWALVDNAPAVNSVLGVLLEETTAKKASALAAIASENGVSHFVSMNKSGEWTKGGNVYSEFPVTGFANLSYNLMYRERLLLAGGKSSNGDVLSGTWSTMDGVSWALLSEDADFGGREGASVALYDSTFFMIGGFDAEGAALKDIYRSKDNGLSWVKSDTLVLMPDEYKAKGYSSMVVDDKTNIIYLFGGKDKKNTNDLGELWRGQINRLGFKK